MNDSTVSVKVQFLINIVSNYDQYQLISLYYGLKCYHFKVNET